MSVAKSWSVWQIVRGKLEGLRCVGLLIARLTIADVFVLSGWGKLHDIPHVVEFFTTLGIPAPEFQARLASFAEFSCGSLLLVGLCTRLASIPLIITMIVAIATAKRAEISSVDDITGFTEYLYIVILIWLLIEGAGMLSLDALLSRKLDKKTA